MFICVVSEGLRRASVAERCDRDGAGRPAPRRQQQPGLRRQKGTNTFFTRQKDPYERQRF